MGPALQGPWPAGQGCWELETGPVAESLGQGLMALGICHGVLALGQGEKSPRGWAGAGRAHGALWALIHI